MKSRPTFAAFASVLLLLPLTARGNTPHAGRTHAPPPTSAVRQQQPQPSPSPRQQDAASDSEDEVVRITSNLVQIDAVVTDDKGRRVTDLRPEEFEVVVGDRQQQITNFSYISDETPAGATADAGGRPAASPSGMLPPARTRLRPGEARRVVAFVVDNLCASFEDVHYARQSIRKFVNEQMQPNDLVAVVQTIGGTGVMQQFTADKRLALAAVEGVRFNVSSSRLRLCGLDEMAAFEGDPLRLPPLPGQAQPEAEQKVAGDAGEDRETIFRAGTLGALNFILKGLKDAPGRKSLVLLSDRLPYPKATDDSSQLMEAYRRLTDLANRSSVVIYTVDLRGLPTLGLEAADNTSNMSPQRIRDRMSDRRSAYFFSQTGMSFLSRETGGFFVSNTNDIAGGLRRAVDDQTGYYLIGFRPDEKFFDPVNGRARFNQFRLKVRRPGLTVRTRSGFYGFTDEALRPARRTRNEQLLGALASPFAGGEMRVGLTSLFTAGRDGRPFVNSLLHLDVKDLSLTEEAGGWRQAVFDVMAVLFDAEGRIVEQVNRTETMRARGQTFERLSRDGLVYVMQVPVKKPGFYQLRVAVRDARTEKLGAAGQLVEVPDLGKGRLTLSGIVLRGRQADAGTATASDLSQPPGGPALRRFRSGSEVEFTFNIYNARLDRETGRPRLQTQTRLLRDGKPFFTGKVFAFEAAGQTDMKNLMVGSSLGLGKDFPPGEYALQVFVTDALAKEKQATATQWVDFQIVE